MPLNIAVIGAGAFGRNHIRIHRELPQARLAAVVESNPARLAELAATGVPLIPASSPRSSSEPAISRNSGLEPVPTYPTTEALLAAIAQGELQIDAASVCTPTSTHHAIAAQLLQTGIHVLVEKPIAATLEEADALIDLAAEHDRILTVGHLERFNPAVQATLPLLRGPMFFEAHRLSVFSPRSLDTDVVLDLMIHDLDIVLTLTGNPPITSVHAVGLPILSGRTDIANVRVEFSTGCVANFTASRVSTERVRKLRFFQPHQYLSIDYARQDLLVIEVQAPATVAGPQEDASAPQFGSKAGAPPISNQIPSPALSMSKPEIASAEPLRLELASFLDSIQTGISPEVSAPQARDALALALQIQQAIANHARHAGLQAFIAG